MTNKQLLEILNEIAPFEYAESWDNVGLLIDSGFEYTRVLVALDLTEAVIREAEELGCGAVVCHHPAIFSGIKRISFTDPVYKAIRAGLSVFAAHTNFDAADGGVNDVLSNLLGLKDVTYMGDNRDGRIGAVDETDTLSVAEMVKKALGIPFVEVADAGRPVAKICVVGGAGGSFAEEAHSLGCDLLITGECKHSDALKALSVGLSVVVAGHHETEDPSMKDLCAALKNKASGTEFFLSRYSSAPFERI